MNRRTLLAAIALAPAPASAAPGDAETLAGLLAAETRGEPLAGQIAVAHVLLNRVASPLPRFAADRSIASACHRHAQFACASRDRELLPVARRALELWQAGTDLAQGAVYFARLGTRAPWMADLAEPIRIGRHGFWRT